MSIKIATDAKAPVVMVDDNEDDIFLAEACYQESALSNPFMTMSGGPALLSYMEQVLAGDAVMPAIVLLDINMPVMNGFEVLSEIRRRDRFREVPVMMMLTNSDRVEDIEKAQRLGADGFQTKPMGVGEYVTFFKGLFG